MSVPESKSQTLITGVYRTGSEYLTQLIDQHPGISATMYRVNVLRFTYDSHRPIRDPHVQRRALSDIDARLRERYGMRLDVARVLSRLAEQDRRVDHGIFYDVVMSDLYLRGGVVHWAEKNQLLWRQIPLFIDMMPNGRAILLVRDPRAVLASFKRYTNAAPPGYLGAIFNCYDAMKAAVDLRTSIGSDRFFFLRYEDLARSPLEWTVKIWRFLQLDEPFPDLSSGGKWKDAYGKAWHANSSYQPNEVDTKFDVEAAIHGWRKQLSPAEVSLTEIVCGEWMSEFGYEESMQRADWMSALRLFHGDSRITGHFNRWLHRGEGIQEFPSDPLNPSTWEAS